MWKKIICEFVGDKLEIFKVIKNLVTKSSIEKINYNKKNTCVIELDYQLRIPLLRHKFFKSYKKHIFITARKKDYIILFLYFFKIILYILFSII